MIEELSDAARRALSQAGVGAGEDKTWGPVVEQGWLWVCVPEARGGLSLGMPAACALYKELGRCLAGAAYLPAMLSIDALVRSGAEGSEALVEEIAAGRRVASPLAGAALSIGNGKLSGTAFAVHGADGADRVLLWTPEMVLLTGLASATLRPRQAWDATRLLSEVHFENVAIDDGLVLAHGERARALSLHLSAHRDLALAADCVGASEALLETTVQYLNLRQQFGRPLAMFQALKHRCADLRMRASAADALLLTAAAEPERDRSGAGAKMAKQFAGAVFREMAEEAVQLHGGIAVTSEHVAHLFLKRAFLNQQLGDGPDREEVAIASDLVARC